MMNRAGVGQFPPPPQEFHVDPETAENEAWEEAALVDTIMVFDAATAEEARRRWAEEMGERWRAELERLRMERVLHQHQRREVLEQQLREESAAAEAAVWEAEADVLAAAT
jgi:hypothetical protein